MGRGGSAAWPGARRLGQARRPDFDFDAGFKRFTDGFKIATDSKASIRGSRSGELVARCIVETGTSSYYAA
jgi:hypothetical protein